MALSAGGTASLLILASLLWAPQISWSQSNTSATPGSDDMDVKAELRAIQLELLEIRQLLQSQSRLPQLASGTLTQATIGKDPFTLPFIPGHSIGQENAAYVVVEFSDLQCPFCIYFDTHTFPEFKAKYIDTGIVRFFNVDFPLESHRDAKTLALASDCAGDQNRYWEMRALLMKEQADSLSDTLDRSRRSLHLDGNAFSGCMADSSRLARITRDAEVARGSGVASTPTFLIGQVSDGKITGTRILGSLPPDVFNSTVEAAIALLKSKTLTAQAYRKDSAQ
jgi:protein-disulfide isomerase